MQKSSRPSVRAIIPVASGKGGVGKSTVSVNLALALAHEGARVGIMDADVYGPTIPTLLGIQEKPQAQADNRLIPIEKYGLKVMSMGFFVKEGEAVVWRGPMLHKTMEQFLGGVIWGELDYLIVDLPPGCLTADTLVSTDKGPVQISEAKEGSYVYSFDGHLNKARYKSPWELHAALVKRKVLAVIPQGRAQVYELRTATRSIRGTEDHPLMVLHRAKRENSRLYGYSLEWRHLAQLKPGDVILVVKKLPQDNGKPFQLPHLNTTANARVSVHISEDSSEDLLRLVGYFLGDGTMRKTSDGNYWGIWFSEPEGGTYRAKYVQLLKTLFNLSHIHQQPNKFAALSTPVAELFDTLGLHYKALDKMIPGWVFSLPTAQKLALIEGYCDADGHRRTSKVGYRRAGWMCFESPNKGLIEGLRALCIDVGFKVNNLNQRTRQTRLPSTGRTVTSTFYGFEANRKAKTDLYGAGLIRGSHIGQGLRHEYIGFEKVRSVKPVGIEEVYDLQVKGEHNFVANGFIVHNTGDIQLSLCQIIPLTGAVIVSTPQDVALQVATKAIAMFRKLNCPILGIIENMSYYICPHCGKREEIFGSGGAQKAASKSGVSFLGEIPLATPLRLTSDEGKPIMVSDPNSPISQAFRNVAQKLVSEVKTKGSVSQDIKISF